MLMLLHDVNSFPSSFPLFEHLVTLSAFSLLSFFLSSAPENSGRCYFTLTHGADQIPHLSFCY